MVENGVNAKILRGVSTLLYMSWEERRESSVFITDNQVKALPLFCKHSLLSVETGV